jgi:tRNA A37 threonylcarbamoyladenosine dehydratase
MDHVAESNVNRQIHAITPTIGQSKIIAMQERIFSINPACKVNCVDDFVTPENWLSVLPPGVDAVIDACDQVKSKVAMAVWAKKTNRCFITVGAAGGKRLAHGVDIADLSVVTHDPLLAQMRYQLRKHHGYAREGKKMGLSGVFSKEAVRPADPSCAVGGDGTLNCHGYGSMVSVTATFGLCAAGWVIDKISQASEKPAKNDAII